MIKVDFLKTLTLLYVEDDVQVREKFVIILNKLFKKVFIASDGVEGLAQYNQSNIEGSYIDLIISDISMPNMDGVALLEHIRQIDKHIPFIFTTAYTNSEYLISSIQQGVTNYFVKPVDAKEIIYQVQKDCELKQKEKELSHYQHEIEEYMNVIDKVAMVCMFDLNGELTYVNEFFKEVTEYTEEELLGKDYKLIAHPDMAKSIFDKQWDTLQNGKMWKGKIKHISKNDAVFYTNTTILPMHLVGKTDALKYMSIKFLTTKDENEKREYKKKVLFSLQETKRINQLENDKIEILEQKISQYKGLEKIEIELENQKKVSSKYYEKIQELEQKIALVHKKYENLTLNANNQIRDVIKVANDLKMKKETANQNASLMRKEIILREELISKFTKKIKEQSSKINDLQDVVKHRETQLQRKN